MNDDEHDVHIDLGGGRIVSVDLLTFDMFVLLAILGLVDVIVTVVRLVVGMIHGA
jgi:hypothetical protein